MWRSAVRILLLTMVASGLPAVAAPAGQGPATGPAKPAGMDAARWGALQGAITKAISQQTRLEPTVQGQANAQFGLTVALSGDTAVVVGQPEATGSTAYVFVRNGAAWTQQASLQAPDGGGFTAAAISADTVILGGRGGTAPSNQAFVFVRDAGAWTLQASLTPTPEGENTSFFFGRPLALSGDTALISASTENSLQGAVYVFVRSGSTWTREAKLVAADGASGDRFGTAVALSGETALVGTATASAAYVFVRSAGSWTQQARLVASDGAGDDRFGVAVGLSGDTALIGAPNHDAGGNTDQGAAYLFTRTGSSWTEDVKLVDAAAMPGINFGAAVAVDGDRALVASIRVLAPAPDPDTPPTLGPGQAHVYLRQAGTWSPRATLIAADGAPGDGFAGEEGIALSGDTALIGAATAAGLAPESAPNAGAAYVFTGVPEPSTTALASPQPDPPVAGSATTVVAQVTGASAPPADGQVVFTASTGETCTAGAVAATIADTAEFRCDLSFATVGPRTLDAAFSGSTTHFASASAAQPLAVIAVLAVAPASLPAGTFAAGYGATVTASGAGSTAPYTFALSSGALPAGLGLDPASGAISGTPSAAGSSTFTITASDSSAAGVGGPFTGSRSYSLTIAPAAQGVSFGAPPAVAVGGAGTLSASGGGSGNPVVFTSQTPAVCTVSGSNGSMVSGVSAGTCTIAANQAGSANFSPAPQVTQTIAIGQASQVISFGAPPAVAVGGTGTLSASGGGSGNLVVFTSQTPAVCTVSGSNGSMVSGVSAGTCTIAANQAGSANFSPAPQVTQTFTVSARPQFTVGGSIAGYQGSGLRLQLNGGVELTVAVGATQFVFPAIDDGSPFAVTVVAQPAEPRQACTVDGGTGTLAGAAVSTVLVSCQTTAQVPAAPLTVQLAFAGGSATVSWTPPADDGGWAVSGYRVTLEPGGLGCEVSGTPPPTRCQIAGIRPGVSYTASVAARNGIGLGAAATATGSAATPPPEVIPVDRPWALLLLAALVALGARRSAAWRLR